VDKETSSQLLTDSEIMVARVNPSKYIREEWKLKYPISSFEEIAIAQAQLDKVKNPPKLDKPDGEGWWWFRNRKGQVFIAFITMNSGKDYVGVFDKQHLIWLFLSEIDGTWQRALVPEG